MAFDLASQEVPSGLAGDGFVLRPITAADAEMDYAAVMESREYLLGWEQTGWPAEDFTVAANREDLVMLEERHAEGRAFTYTVTDPAGTECLGCVYFMPTDTRAFKAATITPAGGHRWDDYQAAIYYWVRRPLLGTAFDRGLLDTLGEWLARDWRLDGHLFMTSELFTQQVALIARTDLELRFTVEEPGKPGRYLAYG
ncbi:N-acetyltransferase [Glycomyces sp. NPDC046736]|uniref:N-acetyltransferase n=1 Tax=Glycomyces sp. NPDC046736 TaxID=3155615 RepID=UPI0033DEF2E3